ncbi:sulfatase, partial [Halalkalibaculum sp. DA384]
MYQNTTVFLVLSTFLLSIAACTPGQQQETGERPNIVFIMSDDHSYQTLSAYDDRFIETPHLDR